MSEKLLQLGKGVEGLFVKNNRFNTTLISYNFILPLKKATAAAYALLPFILTTCSKRYPDFSRLNYKLAKLYGARLNASVEKNGDYQLLRMTISVINDRFSLDGESLVKNASDLMLGLIFEPNVENNAFKSDDLKREKRKAIEHIKGEISEKQIYAKNRLIEELFKNEAYGIPKCGTVEDVEAITEEGLFNAWRDLLETAFVRVQVIGANVPNGLFEEISERFSNVDRENVTKLNNTLPTAPNEAVNTVTEYLEVTQGKLCMGFSSEEYGDDDNTLPLMVMNDIFGGGPYSTLFSNVREKMSLCYYCSAGINRKKGLLIVSSGLEKENCEKAQREILNQLKNIQNGNFDDGVFEASIKSITDSLTGYYDSQGSIDLWYSIKIGASQLYSPEDIKEKILNVTKSDVIKSAKGIKLHTVYKLLPKEETDD